MLRWEAGPQGAPSLILLPPSACPPPQVLPATLCIILWPIVCLSLCLYVYSLCLPPTSPSPTTHSCQALHISVIDILAMEM